MLLIRTTDKDFNEKFDKILERGAMDMAHVSSIVGDIISQIRSEGDAALYRHIEKFDRWKVQGDNDLMVSPDEMKKAYDNLEKDLRAALHMAYDRIEKYHEKQMPKSWIDFDESGNTLGQKVTPVDRAGLYIPGGKAAYPSSLLMNAIPAIVAGVSEIVVTTPTPDNEINHLLLAAAHLCGIKKMFKVGGASAIAAMAYGTETIPKVDVVTGPGNIFVATAKKMVYGDVNIDMIAGPSEIGILADETAIPEFLAIDLLSQAEHDEMASSILVTPSEELAEAVRETIYLELPGLERELIARKSIEERGAMVVTQTMEEAIDLMNRIAPEHLEVTTANPFELLPKIRHAGAIFLGSFTPEAVGDYMAGPNHTLPTGGTARFYSPLNVENFLKKSSIIAMSEKGIENIGEACALLAKTEGLTAHEKSVRIRLK
ncbi:histidinol dehydrogenase [Hydrogenimonas sp.]